MEHPNKTKKQNIFVVVLIVLSILNAGCKKLIDVDAPMTNTFADNVYGSDATAAAVLTGIYTKMANSDLSAGGISSISLFAGLSSDELTLFSLSNKTYFPYYSNSLTNSSTGSSDFWMNIYSQIFVANAAIEGLSESNGLSPVIKRHLLGEAKFVRAFCYFYLLNLYGDVPLVTSTDVKINSQVRRTAKEEIYQQIINDLKEAKELSSDTYLNADALTSYPIGTEERVRPNKWAAIAMLARAYLYTGDHINAEIEASNIIGNSSQFRLTTLMDVFNKNSAEAIWQLQPTGISTSANTKEGRMFVLLSPPNTSKYPVYLSNNIVQSFEMGDQRKINWIDSLSSGSSTYYFPYKYKVGEVSSITMEYSMVLRLAEQYLIRAEARAQQNDLDGALTDLNVIRRRAGLPDTIINDKSTLLQSILQERKVELFTEWGHRWLDMKRVSSVDNIMAAVSPLKGGTWETTDQLYPIAQYELTKNPNINQNPGY